MDGGQLETKHPATVVSRLRGNDEEGGKPRPPIRHASAGRHLSGLLPRAHLPPHEMPACAGMTAISGYPFNPMSTLRTGSDQTFTSTELCTLGRNGTIHSMKRLMSKHLLIAAGAAFLSACSPISPEHSRLMDEIEQSVVLPTRAEPIGYYARYYAYGPQNTVIGFYKLRRFMAKNESTNCLVDDEIAITDENKPPQFVSCASEIPIIDAGERQWIEDWRKSLPPMIDRTPPCSEISIVYDLIRKKFKMADCISDYTMP